jgi:C4-dicarboxylate transporter
MSEVIQIKYSLHSGVAGKDFELEAIDLKREFESEEEHLQSEENEIEKQKIAEMKNPIYQHLVALIISMIFQQCNSYNNCKDITVLICPQIDSLLGTFSEDLSKEDSASIFVILTMVRKGLGGDFAKIV